MEPVEEPDGDGEMAQESRKRENGAGGEVHAINYRSGVAVAHGCRLGETVPGRDAVTYMLANGQPQVGATGHSLSTTQVLAPTVICDLSRLLAREMPMRGAAKKLARLQAGLPLPAGEDNTMLGTILLLILILMLLGAVPAWPYSRQWGYAPSGGIGLVLMVVLILVLLRHI